MTDPLQLLDDYATEDSGGFQYGSVPVDRDDAAPKAFAALRAVLDLHAVAPGYDWCMHCTGGEHHEPWPCPTVQAITTALEASS